MELLREQSSSPDEDVQSFLDANAFNWLIAGTEAPRPERDRAPCASL
jgi:hypothetical protein